MVEDTDVQEPNKPMFSSVEEAEKEYKKLQTNLNKAHQTSKEAMLNRFVVDDLVSRVDELTETVIKASSKDYYENDEENPFRDVEAKGAGGESSSASNGLPSDLDELRSKMRDKSWFREHRSEILKAAKNGQL
jgi:hypothetical protein